ncbi:kek1 family protein [Megaselia abdita]
MYRNKNRYKLLRNRVSTLLVLVLLLQDNTPVAAVKNNKQYKNSNNVLVSRNNELFNMNTVYPMTQNHNDVYSVVDDYNNESNGPPQHLSSCQTVCTCKWKGGKQTVECIDKSLIQIPKIDASTQVLDMSGNNLQTLSNDQFIRANLLNLQKLFLRNCKIGEIEFQTFKGLTNLVELDLSYNLLVSIPSEALSFLPSLRDLTIAANHIHKIDAHTFEKIPSLHELDLSHCDIQTIAPQAFEGLNALTSLKLNGNKLTELRPKTIETFGQLHAIELHDNPWVCDCRLRAAKLWLTEKNIPYPVAPVCSGGPERIIDKTFAELHVDDFACRPELLPINRYVEAYLGENASIVCRASAIPSPIINWYWNGRLLSNGSAFSPYQRIYVYEDGQFEKKSRLILTNSQETDSSEFYCVAENKAGTIETNFTLHVSERPAGMASLGSGQIVGLSAALGLLIIIVLLFIMFVTVRLRRPSFLETKTPNHLEVIKTVNQNSQSTGSNKSHHHHHHHQQQNVNGGVVIANGGIVNSTLETDTLERSKKNDDSNFTNPLQKPPRLTTDIHPTTSTANVVNDSSIASPTGSGNNPDLINDTRRFGDDEEFADLKIPAVLTTNINELTKTGEYSRVGGVDSLYPSGLWDTSASGCLAFKDTTPIIDEDNTQLYDFSSKTFPRKSSTSGGYPSDYGLPLVPGAEQHFNTLHHNNQQSTAVYNNFLSNSYNNLTNNNNNNNHHQQQQQQQNQQQHHHHHPSNNKIVMPNGMPVNAKTIRVWQKGGVPVLPPVTALKRAFITNSSRNSPDEGYQEGCGTDV